MDNSKAIVRRVAKALAAAQGNDGGGPSIGVQSVMCTTASGEELPVRNTLG